MRWNDCSDINSFPWKRFIVFLIYLLRWILRYLYFYFIFFYLEVFWHVESEFEWKSEALFAYCSETLSIKAFKSNASNSVLFSFWKLIKIWKGPGDQFIKKGSSWRGTHPFVWSLIKEEKETLALMLEYFINITYYEYSQCILYLQFLRVGTCSETALVGTCLSASNVKRWIFKSNDANIKFKCLDLKGILLANRN